MTLPLWLSLISLFVSGCSLGLSIVALNSKQGVHKQNKKAALGKVYAEAAWVYALAQPEANDPAKLRKHAEQSFVLIDTSADGKRDFTDKQMAVYLDASKP